MRVDKLNPEIESTDSSASNGGRVHHTLAQSSTNLQWNYVCLGGGDVAGDLVVYHFHSAVAITIRVKQRDATIRLPFCSCKQRTFWCLQCFWVWLWHDGGLQLGRMQKSDHTPPFLFHTLPFFLDTGMQRHFLVLTCEHFKSTDAFGILLAGFYESVLLCISHNNPCHWMLGPQMMQTKLQLLHSYYNSAVHTCRKGLLFWIGACKYLI